MAVEVLHRLMNMLQQFALELSKDVNWSDLHEYRVLDIFEVLESVLPVLSPDIVLNSILAYGTKLSPSQLGIVPSVPPFFGS